MRSGFADSRRSTAHGPGGELLFPGGGGHGLTVPDEGEGDDRGGEGITGGEAAVRARIARDGRSAREWLAALLPAAEQAAQAYPRLRELYAAYRDQDPDHNSETSFTYGLDRILDGLQIRLDQVPAG
ncbi:hypothetical protein [Rhizohabitans arisaemae]|uniref:hypothetical protein n=1 Tax=Rhizohabitans arisaemae TaxID=2720610 RepID=UPI0024B21CF8|nr:hypothetical protein [Rhizohabitans arisaemae]